MRMLSKLLAGATVVATVTMVAAGPALADPPTGTTPAAGDVVGVGADTTENLLDQLALNYDASNSSPSLYSWDATNPTTGAIGDSIATKAGCKKIARPDGSSAGITTLASNIKDPADTSDYCVDYARSARGRKSTDPGLHKGGIEFVRLATDAVTYASIDSGSNAPTNLSNTQLQGIYDCSDTTWTSVGGTSTQTIKPYLPESGSGIASSFLTDIGVSTPGSCVTQPSTLQQNEGVNAIFTGTNKKNIIIPFSTGKWIAQAYHSAPCFNVSCATNSHHEICNAGSGGTNAFGCDVNGKLGLNDINGTSPTTGSGSSTTVNPSFTPDFILPLYDVVRYSTATTNHIPPYLEPFFAAASYSTPGYLCQTAQQSVIEAYGFDTTILCGSGS
jgi:ABC-type phosphate transport system substrate-binding protein